MNQTKMSLFHSLIKVTKITFKVLSLIKIIRKYNNSKQFRRDLKRHTSKTFSFNNKMKD